MKVSSMRFLPIVATAIAAVLVSTFSATPSHAANVFKQLAGTWSGSGNVRFSNGKRERLKCRAYYTKKGASGLGLAIRCASSSNKIHMRGVLRGGGSAISGTWEERTFNAGGSVSGKATGSSLRLAIRGSISGSLSISVKGKRHSVHISTGASDLKGVSLSFRRR